MKLTKLFVGAFALSAMLVACGDDSASAKDTDQPDVVYSDVVVETFDNLPVCSDNRDGSTAYVKDEKTTYICTDGSWVPEEETSSSSIASTSSSSWQALSSTTRNDSSSSSVMETSSSSAIEIASSSSTIRNDNSSSSSETTQSSSSITTTSVYGTLTDTRDGKTYKTVTIGDQTWMAENLNYAYTGVPYNKVTGSYVYTSDSTSWCYDNDPANCAKYGRLYTWAAAIDSVKLVTDADNPLDCGYGKTCGLSGKVQGVCPEGWHLPDTTEWNTLVTAVGGLSTAGKVLKSQTGWTAYDRITITNEDSFGFSALPAGYRYNNGYYYEGYSAYFWSSTEARSFYAYRMYLYYSYDYAYLSDDVKNDGRSVRCLKD